MIVHLWLFLIHLKYSWYLSISNPLVLKLKGSISSSCQRMNHTLGKPLPHISLCQHLPLARRGDKRDPVPLQTVSIPPEFPDKSSQATSYFFPPVQPELITGSLEKSILPSPSQKSCTRAWVALGSILVTSKQALCWEIQRVATPWL